eukprot:14683247-Alexandrium_andersonii.AAC.1
MSCGAAAAGGSGAGRWIVNWAGLCVWIAHRPHPEGAHPRTPEGRLNRLSGDRPGSPETQAMETAGAALGRLRS